MPRLSEARRNDRRQALLDAARATFAEHGFEAATIAAIAQRADVSDGLLYRYFADKRALLAAVLERYLAETIERAEAAVAGVSSFRDRLRALIAAQLSAFAEDPDVCDLYIRELRDAGVIEAGSPLRALTRRYTDMLVAIIEDAATRGEIDAGADARMIRDLVFGGIEHIAWHSLSGGPALEVAGTADRLAALIARGVGAKEQG